jgi:hypothetical protein
MCMLKRLIDHHDASLWLAFAPRVLETEMESSGLAGIDIEHRLMSLDYLIQDISRI